MQGRVHIWDSGNIIADIGTETVYYIRVLTLIYAKKGETKTYYRFNGHGDVIALANSSGAIIKRYKYDSFGVEENPGIFDTNVFRYCGEYYDAETKTIYLRARYYDAETGRFTQQDGWSYAVPGFLLSLNLYTYCCNDPVMNIDPSGHKPYKYTSRDLDGDGKVDYYVYEYEYNYKTGWWIFKKTHTGTGYIYFGVSETGANYKTSDYGMPADFNAETDLIIIDKTDAVDEQGKPNPNLQALNAHKVNKQNRDDIIDVMRQYDEDFNTPWDRTKESLEIEWKAHHKYSAFSQSARDIDFDNNDEGKNKAYFNKKAIKQGLKKVKQGFNNIINMLK